MCLNLGLHLVFIVFQFGSGILQPVQSGTQICEDIFYPGTKTCDIILQNNLCEKPYIKGKYCAKSCKQCQEGTTAERLFSTWDRLENTLRSGITNLLDDSCDDPEALYCDVEGLMAFKNSLTQGQDILSSWTGDYPCSGWKYVTCELIDVQNERVTNISNEPLPTALENKIVGKPVQDLSKLRYIKEIKLSSIKFSSRLPQEFSVFNNLTAFVLRKTGIYGQLPSDYSTWSQIEVFEMSNNLLAGTIPKHFSLWTKIQKFNLVQNRLISGQIWPNFSRWASIKYFSVDQNYGISGTLPKEFTEWKQIQQISTLENKINGTIPKEYSILKDLMRIDFTNNSLTGNLPVEYSMLTNCENFRTSKNFLTRSLPPQYSTLTRMKYFYFINNSITGTLPKEYSTMLRLKKFVGYQNQIQTLNDRSYFENYNVSCYIPYEWSKLRKNIVVNVTMNFVQSQVHYEDRTEFLLRRPSRRKIYRL